MTLNIIISSLCIILFGNLEVRSDRAIFFPLSALRIESFCIEKLAKYYPENDQKGISNDAPNADK